LTTYDSASVMHYPQCNGTQTGDLVLTNLDRSGAAALYP
jgi:serralysin